MRWVIGASLVLALSACDGAMPGDDGGGQRDSGVEGDGSSVCASSVDCDDGLYCNGAETCDPSGSSGNARGCVAGASPCASGQTCSESTDSCMHGCNDHDGDGHLAIECAGDDCDDGDSDRFPGNAEVCDAAGHDEDCDPTTFGLDADGDGAVRLDCCQAQGGSVVCGGDCNDRSHDISPTAPESCNGVDDNCDGAIDEGVQATFYVDADRDGFGDADGVSVSACARPSGFVDNASDCDDSSASVSPSALEVCNGADDDCDEATDDGVCVACPAGYSGFDGACLDIDECAAADTCGRTLERGSVNLCTNTPGSYACACGSGFQPAGAGATASCVDTDECARATDDCDRDPAAICGNTSGAFDCACPSAYVGAGHGTGGCLLDDPSLLALVPSNGALSPAFDPATTSYTVDGVTAWTITLTAVVAEPSRTTIRIDGVTVSSGTPSAPISVSLTPRAVTIVVTTESGATRAYTIVIAGLTFTYVKASNTGTSDQLGNSVALSADGTTLAIGAPGEASAATGIDGDQTSNTAPASGAVYVFRRSGVTWTQEAYIKASNTAAADQFGYTIALSADGSTLAVTARSESSAATGIDGDQSDDSAADAGAVYVFRRSGTTWAQEAYVKASNTDASDRFGFSLALSADGTTLAVGAPYEGSISPGIDGDQMDNSATNAGAVYVFRRSGASWAQEAYVKSSSPMPSAGFGYAVALSSDGSTLAVGAAYEDGTGRLDSGAVYLFQRAGATWSEQALLLASNAGANDHFGWSLCLSADGTTLAVGAPHEDSMSSGVGGEASNDYSTDSGAAYVFRRSGALWAQEAYVKASHPDRLDRFGSSLALSADGSLLDVGAPSEDSDATALDGDETSNTASDAGAVYAFRRTGTTWAQHAYLKATNTDPGDAFGFSIARSGDGSLLAVGARSEDSDATGIDGDQSSNAALTSGAVYLY